METIIAAPIEAKTAEMGVAALSGGEALLAAVRAELMATDVRRVLIAPGYLFAPGLEPLWNALETSAAQEIHLMTGNTAGLLTVEQRFVAESDRDETGIAPELDFAASAREERDRVRDEVARALRENLARMPRTPEAKALLLALARAVAANRVRVRVYSAGRQHTKAIIVEKTSGVTAFMGTTNITLPVAANPTQINVRISQKQAANDLYAWLNALWDDAQDFSRALFDEISARLTEA